MLQRLVRSKKHKKRTEQFVSVPFSPQMHAFAPFFLSSGMQKRYLFEGNPLDHAFFRLLLMPASSLSLPAWSEAW